MTIWRGLNITDGTDQAGRRLAALEPGYFNVDELSFEDLLAMGAEFAAVTKFYGLNNEVNGDWGELFHSDEAVIMAMILSVDIKRIESDYIKKSVSGLVSQANYVLEMAKKINFWFVKLKKSQHKSGEVLAQKMAAVISEKLIVELHNVGATILRIEESSGHGNIADFSPFGRLWCIGKKDGASPFYRAKLSHIKNVTQLKQQLSVSFYIFLNSISYLKMITPIFFQESMGSQQHEPAIGAFLVFLKLYERVQRKLNTFTQRHLDFYYEQILKAKNRESVTESVYLLVETQAGVDKAFIRKNTEFSAGTDKALNEVIYCADENLVVTDATVKSVATLFLQHDNLISPECELGYVTRIKSCVPKLTEINSDEGNLVSWPLFGAEKKGIKIRTAIDATLGFSIASPLLLLKEGERRIELVVEFDNPYINGAKTLISSILESNTAEEFIRLFGKAFAQYLLSYQGCFNALYKNQIITKAKSILQKQMAEEVASLLTQDWQGLFYKTFKKIFSIKLTTENGWLNVLDYIIVPYAEKAGVDRLGIRIRLNLGMEDDPITPYMPGVHGGEFETELPVLQCLINPQTNFYPYSIFQDHAINSLQVNVDVKGVKHLLAYNQYGQLDPSKPFHPFGPIPTRNSYFIFGNYELAIKKLVDLNINLEWAELPSHAGGFGEYYRSYETQYSNSVFKGEFTTLLNSSWLPADSAAKPAFSLFESEMEGDRLSSRKTIPVDIVDYSRPIDVTIAEEDYQYDLKARNGFFRLSITGPESAFGHGEYPTLLTKIVSANARLKKPEPVPNLPYTPILSRMTLDYKASTRINLVVRGDENDNLEKIYHMHPFGVETVYPAQQDNPLFLMPQYENEGNLFIGISAKDITGVLTLFFHLSEEQGQERGVVSSSINWSYLTSNKWKAMTADQVLSDSTHGLLSSGIVTLSIPGDISRDNSTMPGDFYWLRVSTPQDASSFDSIYSIQTNAIKVSRKRSEGDNINNYVPDNKKWTPVISIPGVSGIKQIAKPFGGKPKESDNAIKTRTSERLRHKNRAMVPWDYERLILEQFAGIYKVKCFSNISSVNNSLKPGHVLIVVVPNTQSSYSDDVCSKAMVDPEQLSQIKTYIEKITSPFATIEVRNPVYEQVQIRCTVKFADGYGGGADIKRLNQEISDYICPWKKKGYSARFGWSIRQKDMESYIRSMNYVEHVTNFSMLHITVDHDGKYNLYDTAEYEENSEVVIRPRYPWSLAMPVKRHFIETMPSAKYIKEEITGINELEVGSTFIISGNSVYGEKK